MIKVFARVLLTTATFVEFTSDEFLDENFASELLEQLGIDLENLTLEEKQLLTEELKNISSICADEKMSDFVASILVDKFGLIEA